MIMVDNDVNKAHRKFPLDVFLICLKFFLKEDVIIWIGFYFIYEFQVHLIRNNFRIIIHLVK